MKNNFENFEIQTENSNNSMAAAAGALTSQDGGSHHEDLQSLELTRSRNLEDFNCQMDRALLRSMDNSDYNLIIKTNNGLSNKAAAANANNANLTGYPNSNGKKNPPILLPPQRLAIPNKSGGQQNARHENKPLVQWDSEESEEEYFFQSASSQKPAITTAANDNNVDIDSLNLSEDDLHLTPPKSMAAMSCPCDPRTLFADLKNRHSCCAIM